MEAVGNPRQIARLLEPRLREALLDTPVVLIHGPRQSGKTTLARMVGESLGYSYVSFDDDSARDAALGDPVGFVGELPERIILDEVQRVPSLFTAIKSAVDRDRRPGRFILTGSANVLFVPALGDSLAGRMGILRLHPFSQSELAGTAATFLDALFQGRFPVGTFDRLGSDLPARVIAGGYPPALQRTSKTRRSAWYRDYIETQIQRDARDLMRLRSLQILPLLLSHAASSTARLVNYTELAGPFHLTSPTINEYVTLLENIFLIRRLPPWYTNRLSRLVKTPKLHMGDTGLACSLLGVSEADFETDRTLLGPLLETFVFQELQRQASGQEEPLTFYHYRDRDMREVDIVIERGVRQIAAVEVKAASSVSTKDFRGLKRLRDAAGDRFVHGALLYDGEMALSFGDRLHAVPIRMLWEAK